MAERRRKPKYIIGLDFGNSFSFPCYIPELDLAVGRLGGTPRDLLPADMHYCRADVAVRLCEPGLAVL